MNKKRLDALSESLSKALKPPERKQNATAAFLEKIQPIENLIKPSISDQELDQKTTANLAVPAKAPSTALPLSESAKESDIANLAGSVIVAEIKGELRIPNTIIDSLLPILSPAESLIYLRLYRLSYGFGKPTCFTSVGKLGKAVNLSDRTAHRALSLLEQKNLISRTGHTFGKQGGGLTIKVNLPQVKSKSAKLAESDYLAQSDNMTESARKAEFARSSENKDDHDLKNRDHQSETMRIYQILTGNRWTKADRSAYQEIRDVPLEQIEAGIRRAFDRAASRPGSLAYFCKEILHPSLGQSKTGERHRAQLRRIIGRVREARVGAHDSPEEFREFVERACGREGVLFDLDLFNEIVGSK